MSLGLALLSLTLSSVSTSTLPFFGSVCWTTVYGNQLLDFLFFPLLLSFPFNSLTRFGRCFFVEAVPFLSLHTISRYDLQLSFRSNTVSYCRNRS